jgi:transposase InsO family protein
LKSIPINDQAFYRVGIDLLGPITLTPTGNKYIAVAIDYLTKWAEIRAIPNKEANTVATFFEHDVIARHGCPHTVLSDNGLEFKGEFDRLLRKYGIDHHLTAPNHPQTNGLTEKHNATIVTSLNKMVEDNPEKWDTKIPRFLLGYRASRHCATKTSLFYLVYARHPLLPISLTTEKERGEHPEEINDNSNPEDSEDLLARRMNDETRMTSRSNLRC